MQNTDVILGGGGTSPHIYYENQIKELKQELEKLRSLLIFKTKTLIWEKSSFAAIYQTFSIDLTEYNAISVEMRINGYGCKSDQIILKNNLNLVDDFNCIHVNNHSYAAMFRIKFENEIVSGVFQLANDYLNSENQIPSDIKVYGLN